MLALMTQKNDKAVVGVTYVLLEFGLKWKVRNVTGSTLLQRISLKGLCVGGKTTPQKTCVEFTTRARVNGISHQK